MPCSTTTSVLHNVYCKPPSSATALVMPSSASVGKITNAIFTLELRDSVNIAVNHSPAASAQLRCCDGAPKFFTTVERSEEIDISWWKVFQIIINNIFHYLCPIPCKNRHLDCHSLFLLFASSGFVFISRAFVQLSRNLIIYSDPSLVTAWRWAVDKIIWCCTFFSSDCSS